MVRKAGDEAYLYIRRKVATGELAPGRAISEVSLAKKLGISRTPIREAIGQLAREGVLEQIPHRGAVVPKLSTQDIIELYELREALEIFAVGKAAHQPLRQADLDRLQSLNDVNMTFQDELQRLGKPELDPDQMHRYVTYDLAFHTLLIRLAANARLLKVVTETRELVRIFAIRRRGYTIPELADIHREHGDVVRGIVEQNPSSAIQAISDHIQLRQAESLDDLNHWESEASVRQTILRGTRTESLLPPTH
jgi:DNA-binding GntR family transcriptional regulator